MRKSILVEKPIKAKRIAAKPASVEGTNDNEGIQGVVQQLMRVVQDPREAQIGGDHYKKLGDYQPWSVMSQWLTPEELKGYMKGTACAYLCREADKGGREDIEKAIHTMQIYLELSK